MELKQEQVEQLFQFVVDQKAKFDKETTPAKKATSITLMVINLIAFFVICAVTIGYGITSYRETVRSVQTFNGRLKTTETKIDRLDSMTTRIAGNIEVLLKK